MVRFQWHVEAGLGALIPPGGLVQHGDTKVLHATLEIELPNQTTPVEACLTLPPDCLKPGNVRHRSRLLSLALSVFPDNVEAHALLLSAPKAERCISQHRTTTTTHFARARQRPTLRTDCPAAPHPSSPRQPQRQHTHR